MIQVNQIQLTSQTPNQTPSHVEITKILSSSQREDKIIDCCSLSGICFVRNK